MNCTRTRNLWSGLPVYVEHGPACANTNILLINIGTLHEPAPAFLVTRRKFEEVQRNFTSYVSGLDQMVRQYRSGKVKLLSLAS